MKNVIIFLFFVVGCGDSDSNIATDSPSDSGPPFDMSKAVVPQSDLQESTVDSGPDSTEDGTNPVVLLNDIFDDVFATTGCVAGYCHGGAVDGLVLSDSETSRINMLNVDSIRPECGLTQLVVPGKPEESLLWYRVRSPSFETGQPCATKMPKGTDGLDERRANLIFNWIASGAN